MADLSFLSLVPDFSLAKRQTSDPKWAEIKYWQVVIAPNEIYSQITNVSAGISFGGQYQVHVVDACNNIVATITSKVAITEILQESDGSQQMKFEILPTGLEFGVRELYLRLDHTDGGDQILQSWWTAPVIFSDAFAKDSVRLDYWNYSEFEGISYGVAQTKQSVTLRGLFRSGDDDEGEVSGYTQQSGRSISANAISSPRRTFTWQWGGYYAYARLNAVLRHENVYIDGERMTNKVILKGGKYIGASNIMETEFSAAIDSDDTFMPTLQTFDDLAWITYEPFGISTLDNLGSLIRARLNYNAALSTGTVKLFNDEDGTLVHSWNASELTGSSNGFSVNFSSYVTQNGIYRVEVSEGLMTAETGASPYLKWTFTVSEGDYSASDYNSNDYFTA